MSKLKWLFSKKPEIKESTITSNKYSDEVVEIHNSFDRAADEILKIAQEAIQETDTRVIQKAELLEKLGFKNTSEVKTIKKIVETNKLNEETVKLINYYKQKYPFYKFITESKVEEICNKYGLVFGDVSQYKGFVPEKNAKEIANFNIKEEDLEYMQFSMWNNYKSSYKEYSEQNNNRKIRIYGDSKHIFANKALKICAPLSDMETSGYKLEGYKLVKEIPDPIVLHPCNGGYFICSMWSDEKFDPKDEPDLLPENIN